MKQVNAMGDACPLPVIKAKKALEEMESGTLEVLVDNDIAVGNLKRLAGSTGCGFHSEAADGGFRVRIEKTGDYRAPQAAAGGAVAGKTVVVIASDVMGSGDDELGKLLMKGFLFALTQLEHLPDTILLYNGGAKLSVKGSPALDDLIAMDKAGIEILTCGTCLNHYGIADDLAVGEVTNMYSIVEAMNGAGRILRP